MNLSDIIDVIASDLERVEEEIEENIKSQVPLVYDISKYIMGSGGKRFRPSVLLLSSGACGLIHGRERISAAAALELLHTASLLHDDVIDDASLRRGQTASNVIWGNKASILVGDFMLARSLSLIYTCGSLELIRTVTDAAAKLAEGQVIEVMSAKKMVEVSEEVCFSIIENKTASLIESGGRAGAILAGASEKIKDALGCYGLNLGIAFQLTDDALDYSATEEEFGKEVGQDLSEGKMTFPLIYALKSAPDRERSDVLRVLNGGNFQRANLELIVDFVRKYRGAQQTKETAAKFAYKAKNSISNLSPNACKRSLESLADFVVERKN